MIEDKTSWRYGLRLLIEIVFLFFGLINATAVYLACIVFDVE